MISFSLAASLMPVILLPETVTWVLVSVRSATFTAGYVLSSTTPPVGVSVTSKVNTFVVSCVPTTLLLISRLPISLLLTNAAVGMLAVLFLVTSMGSLGFCARLMPLAARPVSSSATL